MDTAVIHMCAVLVNELKDSKLSKTQMASLWFCLVQSQPGSTPPPGQLIHPALFQLPESHLAEA